MDVGCVLWAEHGAHSLRNPLHKGLTKNPIPWNKLGAPKWLDDPIVPMKHLTCAVIFYCTNHTLLVQE